MGKKINYTPDPITGTVYSKDPHLFDVKKVVHSKDDVKGIKDLLSGHNKDWGTSRITGKPRTSTPGGYKASASLEAGYARGHNIRDPNYVEKKEHIDPEGLHKTYLDMGPLEKCYEEIFGEALEEYNKKQKRSDRKIKNYLTHILQDKRRGSMKKNSKVDNSRKPVYEFIFEVGNRDFQVERNLSIEILEKFALEWMPEHYPNLKAISICLHADEFTYDPVTGERIEGNPHIHFNFIPIAHRLSEEEEKDFNEWKAELKKQEIAECKANGTKFSEDAFKRRDWEGLRAERYGKAEIESLSLQSSLSGACAEMGFRTHGANTAQIQMERAIRTDFLDLIESYGIKVDRTVKKDQEKKVKVEVYKAREDARKLLKHIKETEKEVKKESARNKKKEAELEKREAAVSGLEKEKKEVQRREKEVTAREKKISPYVERIDTLVQDEVAVKVQKEELDKREVEQNKKTEALDAKENLLLSKETKLSDKEKVLNERETELDKKEDAITDREIAAAEVEEKNRTDAKTNEKNLKEITQKFEDFAPMEAKYKKFASTVNMAEEIKTDVKGIGLQLKTELGEPGGSWWDKVEYAVGNFTERCQKIVVKWHDAISAFKNFLKGKTPQDFRKLADDMDFNGARTFEEYEQKWSSGVLGWQVEERRKKLVVRSEKRELDIER